MLNKVELLQKISIIILSITLIISILVPIALANDAFHGSSELWNTISEFENISSLRKLLLEKGWVSEDVSIEELDYILVLTRQCSNEFFPNIPTSIVLAIISVESGFNKNLVGFNNDTGLMQIIPKYHQERIDKYIYDDNVDLFDERVNIMVGMNYLNELLDIFNGDTIVAVMGYNEGITGAKNRCSRKSVSGYAASVYERAKAIEEVLREEWYSCS